MRIFLFVLIAIVLISSCEETGPIINLEDEEILVDTTYVVPVIEIPQAKNVFVEEFTGVRCKNCPNGHEKAAEIKNVQGDRFIFISYHSVFLDDPYPFGSQIDMGSADAQLMDEFLGPITAKPSATIDRKKFPGETERVYELQKWSNFVQQQIDTTTPVNIHITTEFDETSMELIVNVRIHYTSEVTEDNKLSVLLIESNIEAPQLDGTVIDTHYIHDEVFRAFITPVKGSNLISPDKVAGREFVKEFLFEDFGDDWIIDEMEVIAFVHRNDVEKEVYQTVHADF